MARKQNDAVSAVDNSDEDVFPSLELLLEATKFDDANVSHDIELKINPKVWKKTPSCSSCESGVSYTGSPNRAKIYCAHFEKRLCKLKTLDIINRIVCFVRYSDIADHFSANHESKHQTKKE